MRSVPSEASTEIPFDPDAARARVLDARMRRRLRESLNHILDRTAGHIRIPQPPMTGFLTRLEETRISPTVFGAYCDLVLAIDADALDEAEALLAEIAGSPPYRDGRAPEGPPRRVLSDNPADIASGRYRRLVDTDPGMPFTIVPPPPEDALRCDGLIAAAIELLDAGHPDLADEIRALLCEIVLAAGPDGPGSIAFDGASSPLLWGAVVLNVAAYETRLGLVQALAHESGHNLLFGFGVDGLLVENAGAERFPSPLRLDPRPMEGILHATYVSARMHHAVHRLADAGVLAAPEQDEARPALTAHRRAFADGLAVIDAHARLTPLGAAILAGARRYMAPFEE